VPIAATRSPARGLYQSKGYASAAWLHAVTGLAALIQEEKRLCAAAAQAMTECPS